MDARLSIEILRKILREKVKYVVFIRSKRRVSLENRFREALPDCGICCVYGNVWQCKRDR